MNWVDLVVEVYESTNSNTFVQMIWNSARLNQLCWPCTNSTFKAKIHWISVTENYPLTFHKCKAYKNKFLPILSTLGLALRPIPQQTFSCSFRVKSTVKLSKKCFFCLLLNRFYLLKAVCQFICQFPSYIVNGDSN